MLISRLTTAMAACLCSVLFLILLCFSAKPLAAQLITSDISQYAHNSWLIRDGFFPGNPKAVTQTTDGYIWVETLFGLLRFDGVSFITATPAGGESLIDHPINALRGARDGSLWIGGVGLVHLKDGRMTSIPAFTGNTVLTILEDDSGDIWVGGGMQGGTKSFVPYPR